MKANITSDDLRPLTETEIEYCSSIGGGIDLAWGNVALTWFLFTVVWKVAFERAAIRAYDRGWDVMARNVPRLSRAAWAAILRLSGRAGAAALGRRMADPAYRDDYVEWDVEMGFYNY